MENKRISSESSLQKKFTFSKRIKKKKKMR